jgi:hypothetical protein
MDETDVSDERSLRSVVAGNRPAPGPAHYGVAIALVLLAAVVRWLLVPLFGARLPFLTFYPAVAIAAWYGGLAPGALATVLAALMASLIVPTDDPLAMRRGLLGRARLLRADEPRRRGSERAIARRPLAGPHHRRREPPGRRARAPTLRVEHHRRPLLDRRRPRVRCQRRLPRDRWMHAPRPASRSGAVDRPGRPRLPAAPHGGAPADPSPGRMRSLRLDDRPPRRRPRPDLLRRRQARRGRCGRGHVHARHDREPATRRSARASNAIGRSSRTRRSRSSRRTGAR